MAGKDARPTSEWPNSSAARPPDRRFPPAALGFRFVRAWPGWTRLAVAGFGGRSTLRPSATQSHTWSPDGERLAFSSNRDDSLSPRPLEAVNAK